MLPVVAALALHLTVGARRDCRRWRRRRCWRPRSAWPRPSCARRRCARRCCERQIGPIDVYGFVELVEPRAAQGPAPDHPRDGAGEARAARVALSRARAHDDRDARARARRRGAPEGHAEPAAGAVAARRLRLRPRGLVPGARRRGLRDRARRRSSPSAVEPPLSLRASAAIARVRQAIGRRVVEALPGQTGAIANALITGERGGISEATNQAFRDSGLFHILSISGLHMVIMAGAVFYCIRLALAAIPADRAALPHQEVGGGGRDDRRVRLSDDLGRGVRHRALLHHDLHHVPGRAARPAGHGAAQRGAGGAGDPAGVAREPVRSGLPDVVRRGGGAGLGLRVAARARGGARRA